MAGTVELSAIFDSIFVPSNRLPRTYTTSPTSYIRSRRSSDSQDMMLSLPSLLTLVVAAVAIGTSGVVGVPAPVPVADDTASLEKRQGGCTQKLQRRAWYVIWFRYTRIETCAYVCGWGALITDGVFRNLKAHAFWRRKAGIPWRRSLSDEPANQNGASSGSIQIWWLDQVASVTIGDSARRCLFPGRFKL